MSTNEVNMELRIQQTARDAENIVNQDIFCGRHAWRPRNEGKSDFGTRSCPCLVTAAETLHGLRSVATRDRLTIWNRLESGEVHGSPTYAKLVTVAHH